MEYTVNLQFSIVKGILETVCENRLNMLNTAANVNRKFRTTAVS